MKVFEVAGPAPVQAAYNDLVRAFKSSPLYSRWSTVQQNDGYKPGSISFGIRDWGKWVNPQDMPADDSGEDYDWQVPTPETKRAAQQIIDSVSSRYPQLNFYLQTSEKNWFDVDISPKG